MNYNMSIDMENKMDDDMNDKMDDETEHCMMMINGLKISKTHYIETVRGRIYFDFPIDKLDTNCKYYAEDILDLTDVRELLNTFIGIFDMGCHEFLYYEDEFQNNKCIVFGYNYNGWLLIVNLDDKINPLYKVHQNN